ncbi:MAG: hypothetical protein ACREJD_04990 [Phycisphaerales bacterium]
MDFLNLDFTNPVSGGTGGMDESAVVEMKQTSRRAAGAKNVAARRHASSQGDADPKAGAAEVAGGSEKKRSEDLPVLTDADQWPGLGGKWAGQLQALLTRMHAMAMDGFAPSRNAFYDGTELHPQAHKKFFPTFTEFAHRCGYRTAMERKCDATRTELVERAAMRRMHALRNRSDLRKRLKKNESAFGNPLDGCDMLHAPTNEQGVVMLFGMLAKELGFVIELVRTGYPDCEAKRQGEDDKWRRVLIEFEYLSGNFNHDPRGCDLIVCWEHNTKENEVDVLELKSVMEERAEQRTKNTKQRCSQQKIKETKAKERKEE